MACAMQSARKQRITNELIKRAMIGRSAAFVKIEPPDIISML